VQMSFQNSAISGSEIGFLNSLLKALSMQGQ